LQKIKRCLKCKIKLHSTDWLILKLMNKMPICDICEEKLSVNKVNVNLEKEKKINDNPNG
jgi:hypothetical protein